MDPMYCVDLIALWGEQAICVTDYCQVVDGCCTVSIMYGTWCDVPVSKLTDLLWNL